METGSRASRAAVAWGMAIGVIVGTAGCASGGHGLEGAEEAALYARISGAWVLNAGESTDVEAALREAMQDGRRQEGRRPGGMRGGSRRPGGTGGPPPGGRPGGVRGDGARPEGQGTRFADELRGSASLEVTVDRELLTIAGPDMLTPLEATPDGESREIPRRGRVMKLEVGWDGPVLEVVREFENGPKIKDRHESADGSRMVVIRTVEQSAGPDLTLVLVYDRPSD